MKKTPPLLAKPNHYAPAPRGPMTPKASPKTSGHPHVNLGKYLHPRKG